MFNPINLDCYSDNPSDLNAVADVLAKLSFYARLKASSLQAHRLGYIKTAQTSEVKADAIYVTLPEWARW